MTRPIFYSTWCRGEKKEWETEAVPEYFMELRCHGINATGDDRTRTRGSMRQRVNHALTSQSTPAKGLYTPHPTPPPPPHSNVDCIWGAKALPYPTYRNGPRIRSRRKVDDCILPTMQPSIFSSPNTLYAADRLKACDPFTSI